MEGILPPVSVREGRAASSLRHSEGVLLTIEAFMVVDAAANEDRKRLSMRSP